MQVGGCYTIRAAVDRVWQVLHDGRALQRCLPGCQKLQEEAGGCYRLTLALGFAPLAGRFSGCIRVEDQLPERRCRLHLTGEGKAGQIEADIVVTLDLRSERATDLCIAGEASAHGPLGRGLLVNLLPGVGKWLVQDFLHGLAREASRNPVREGGQEE